MTEDKERMLDRFILQFKLMAEAKFRKGDAEHKSNLSELSILELNEELLGECFDTIFYLLQQRENIKKLKEKYEKTTDSGPATDSPRGSGDGQGLAGDGSAGQHSELLSELALRPLPDFPADEDLS